MGVELRNLPPAINLGPDVHTSEAVLLRPQERTMVPVTVPDLSDFSYDGEKLPSSRSRFAQIGVHVPRESAIAVFEASKRKDNVVEIPVEVLSQRPIKLLADTNFVRLYEKTGDTFFDGGDLERMIEKKVVKITGKQGHDWDYWVAEGDQAPSGVELFLDPGSRRWVQPNDEPLVLDKRSGAEFDYRKELDMALVPPPKSLPYIYLEIASTLSEVHMTPATQGWIDPSLPEYGNRIHIFSLLINGYDTRRKIRTEQMVKNGESPESVVVKFSPAAPYNNL